MQIFMTAEVAPGADFMVEEESVMPNNAEIAKDTIEQFKKVQDYMALAKEENAIKTYDKLKKEYLSLKALLNVIGVNLIDIDIIKE